MMMEVMMMMRTTKSLEEGTEGEFSNVSWGTVAISMTPSQTRVWRDVESAPVERGSVLVDGFRPSFVYININ